MGSQKCLVHETRHKYSTSLHLDIAPGGKTVLEELMPFLEIVNQIGLLSSSWKFLNQIGLATLLKYKRKR